MDLPSKQTAAFWIMAYSLALLNIGVLYMLTPSGWVTTIWAETILGFLVAVVLAAVESVYIAPLVFRGENNGE